MLNCAAKIYFTFQVQASIFMFYNSHTTFMNIIKFENMNSTMLKSTNFIFKFNGESNHFRIRQCFWFIDCQRTISLFPLQLLFASKH